MLISSRRYKLEIKLKALDYPDIGIALGKLDTLVEKGLMSPFAIGGGLAANWWAEACTTEDLDLFITGYPPSNKVLETLGVEFKEGERWKLAGIPIDIVLVYQDKPLQQEAYNTAIIQNIDGYKERVILPEYIIAKYFERELSP